MTRDEKLAAIGFAGLSAADKALAQMTMFMLEMLDQEGGVEPVRKRLNDAIVMGASTRKFSKWKKYQGIV
jgi:hypothetical protein